jgi:S1-C subfamily serine protease
MKRFAIFAIVLVVLLSGSLWAGQLKPDEKRALELKPAVVLVVVEYKTKWTLPGTPFEPIELAHTETGTGFLFRPDGYLITNGHVVADANLKDEQAREARDSKLKAQLVTELQNGDVAGWFEEQKGIKLTDQQKDLLAKSFPLWRIAIEGNPTLKVILQNGNVLDPEILQYSPPIDQHGKDVAILKIPGSNLPTVKLGNSENVRLQDQIMVMGYPATASPFSNKSTSSLISMESGLEPSATNGHISALKTENNIGTPLLQSDVAIFHGNSGGPAFNDEGEVIGLATYGAQEAQGFNFLVPINTAMEFVRQSGVAPETGAFNKHWAEALDMYDDGQCNHAIAEFDNVAQFMPGLRDAQRFRAASVACVDKMSWFQKLTETTGKWPLLALLAIVILGGGAWLVMSRPSAANDPAKGAAKGPTAKGAGAGQGTFGRIQFSSGSLSGRTFPIGKEGLWIGRDSAKCAVVVQDDSVSSQHAWVVPADGNIMVIDKDSTNGTYINSVDSPRISKVGLRNGDRVYLGQKGAVFTYFAA